MLSKDPLNIMLHLPGDTVKSRDIFIVVVSRKKYFLKVLSGTKALSYCEVQLPEDQITAKLHQCSSAVPTHQCFRGNTMDIHRGWFLLQSDGCWLLEAISWFCRGAACHLS